jgi:hypothetical protein
MRPSVRLLAALLALAALALLPAAASAAKKPAGKGGKAAALKPVTGPLKAEVGIADQKADAFADPRFRALGMKSARRSVGWDALQYDWQREDIDAWMAATRAAGVRPVITFARSRVAERRHMVPTAEQMRRAFVAFRKRYPWVRDYVASNESNHFGEPTGRRPKLAVAYYKAMRRSCPSCRIAAATLLDFPNVVTWARQFVRLAREQPRYWALHSYVSANRFDLARTRQVLLAVKGEVWLTEVGGMVANRTPDRKGKAKLKQGPRHAAKVTSFIFDRLARLSPRITRIYLYHWNSDSPTSTWDSGLVDHKGKPRPALSVVEEALGVTKGKPGREGKAKDGPKPKTGVPR